MEKGYSSVAANQKFGIPEIPTNISQTQKGNKMEENTKKSTGKSSKITGTLRSIVSSITVEPTLFLVMSMSMMYQITTQNLYLEKACRVNIGFNKSICDAMTRRNTSGYLPTQEVEVQKLVSQMFALRTSIQGFFPVCLVLFVGSWTDRHNRRKPAILFPIIGEILCCVFLIMNVIYFYELPIIFTTLADSIFLTICGGWPCLFLGIYSYLAANSTHENRTVRIGAATATQNCAIVFGIGLSGFLFRATGFLNFYIICITMFFVALIFGIFLIKEERTKGSDEKKKCFLKDFFEMKNITSAFRVYFKNDGSNRRKNLIILLIVSATINGPMHGENNVSYMYARYKFGWDYIRFATVFGANALVQIFGAFFSVVVLARILRLEDSLLGILAITGSIASSLVFGLAPTGFIYSFGGLFDILHATVHMALRSILSKQVLPNELGQVNSILGITEALMPFTFGPFYSLLYRSTISFFPGTFYLFSATAKFIGLCGFLWLYSNVKQKKKPEIKDGKNLEMDQKILA